MKITDWVTQAAHGYEYSFALRLAKVSALGAMFAWAAWESHLRGEGAVA